MGLLHKQILKEFNRLNKEIDDLYHDIAFRLDLSDSAFTIFYSILDLGDGCLQKDICNYAFLSKQTISSSINKLVKEGLIYLEPGKGREKHIFLTESGTQLVKEKLEPVLSMEESIFAEMTPEESQELLRIMEKYLVHLRQKTKTFYTTTGKDT